MTDNTQELDVIEQVIRSVLTPNSYIVPQEGIELTKALLDWHNKQIWEVLNRLEIQGQIVDTRLCKREIVATPHSAIEAERNKLKEEYDGKKQGEGSPSQAG